MGEAAKPMGSFSWCLDVECPQCKEEFDAAAQDAEGDCVIAKKIFNNDWDSVAGCELTCPNCGHEFQIGGVEY